jgi:CCR4-NOT transcription complex subunit 1
LIFIRFPDFALTVLNAIGKFSIEEKVPILAEKMTEESVGWFCYMFVKHRASKETNLHRAYLTFLEQIDMTKRSLRVMDNITNTTYDCLNVLLKSVGQALHSTSHRTVLKNLGAWLGACTLGRNKTLKARSLDLKHLLLQATENGHLTAILPMVCNVMEGVAASKVHKLPNPWTTAVMGLLAEIHDLPNLRINLMFEVEVLCKHLGINLPDLHRTSLLQDSLPNNKHDFNQPKQGRWPENSGVFAQLPPPLNDNAPSFGPPPDISHGQSVDIGAAFGTGPTIDGGGTSSLAPPTFPSGDGADGSSVVAPRVQLLRDVDSRGFRVEIEHLQQSVLISRSIALFQIQPQLRDLVPTAVHQAIEEIISAVIERSVTISCLTTREVVSKDFAMEPDENMVKKAAQLMVSSLAGSLALVTCREPLRVSLNNHLRSMLTPASAKDSNVQVLIEQVVQIVSADNLDLGCAIVEKAVVDKALKDVEETIAPQIAIRGRYRHDAHRGETFVDPQYKDQVQTKMNVLPQAIRPTSRPLTKEQLQVYKDFMHANPPSGGPPGPRGAGGAGVVGSEFVPGATAHGQGAPVSVESQANAAALAAAAAATAASAAAAVVGNDVVSGMDGRAGSPPPAKYMPASLFGRPGENMRIRPGVQNARLPYGSGAEAPAVTNHPQGLPRAKVLEIVNRNLQETQNIISRMSPESETQYHDHIGVDPSLDAYVLLNTRRDHPLVRCCEDTLKALEACAVAAEVAFVFTAQLLKRVLDVGASRMSIEVHLLLLDEVKSIVPEVEATYAPSLIRGMEELPSFSPIQVQAFAGAFRYGFLPASEVDATLAKWMEQQQSTFDATSFSVQFLDKVCVKYHAAFSSDFPQIIDTISKRLANRVQEPTSIEPSIYDKIGNLLDHLRAAPIVSALEQPMIRKVSLTHPQGDNPISLAVGLPLDCPTVMDMDLSSLDEQLDTTLKSAAISIFEEWLRLDEQAGEAPPTIIGKLDRAGFLATENNWGKFFHAVTEYCIERWPQDAHSQPSNHPNGSGDAQNRYCDSFARLISCLMKFADQRTVRKCEVFLHCALKTICTRLVIAANKQGASFNQRPWFRIIVMLLFETSVAHPNFEPVSYQMLLAFAGAFDSLNPLRVPSFAFAWLELISHRMFMPKMLGSKRGWFVFQRLIMKFLHFFEPCLRSSNLNQPTTTLYKGFLRVLLVLLHDFPEFLCAYHLSFCDLIPPQCVQVRNLVLSAFPSNMKLPDPYSLHSFNYIQY